MKEHSDKLEVENAKVPQIGHTYLVKCVHVNADFYSGYLPIFGEQHKDDLDAAQGHTHLANQRHIHVDMRFVTEEEIEDFYAVEKEIAQKIVQQSSIVIRAKSYVNPMLYKRLPKVMLRDWSFNFFSSKEHTERFEAKYQSHELDLNCKRCPHKGADLSQVVPVDGKIMCPLHRLVWCGESGRLVTSKELKERSDEQTQM